MFLKSLCEGHTNSPNVGDAPQAIKESSADMMIDVFEQPMLVICQPIFRCIVWTTCNDRTFTTYPPDLVPASGTC